nr:unnamed protein product [Callosobruchus chinensis]
MDEELFDPDLELERLIRERNERMEKFLKTTEFEGSTEEGITEEGITEEGITEEGITEEGITEEGITEEFSRRSSSNKTSKKHKGCPQNEKVPQSPQRLLRVQNKAESFTRDDGALDTSGCGSKVVKRQKPYGPNTMAVEDITESMLNNIIQKHSEKIHGPNGTTCHQCRQKTMDQKTYCRNIDCSGRRGISATVPAAENQPVVGIPAPVPSAENQLFITQLVMGCQFSKPLATNPPMTPTLALPSADNQLFNTQLVMGCQFSKPLATNPPMTPTLV